VERKPAAIQALGSRQVGEVVCDIENPGRELIPGTNVDAEIRTAVVDNALVIPREACAMISRAITCGAKRRGPRNGGRCRPASRASRWCR